MITTIRHCRVIRCEDPHRVIVGKEGAAKVEIHPIQFSWPKRISEFTLILHRHRHGFDFLGRRVRYHHCDDWSSVYDGFGKHSGHL